jgi:DNA-binding PadR family transcriptional regulator
MKRASLQPAEEETTAVLTPAVFHILLALSDGHSHGYGIMQDVEAFTSGEIRLGPGTLYRSIQRMLIDGLIEELEIALHDESDDDRRRHYRLTKKGLEIAQREARRLADLVEVARQRSLLVKRSGAARPSSPRKGGRRDRSRP